MTSYASSDPSVALTAAQASFADGTSPTFSAFATHQRVRVLEMSAAEAAASLALNDGVVSGLAAGAVAYNAIALAVNPTAGDTITIGDVYEFLAAGGTVSNDAYIGVVIGDDLPETVANLIAGIHATYTAGQGTGLFKTGDVLPALANGTENVTAVFAGGVLNIFAADAPGGDYVTGTAPDIACSDNLTEVTAWTYTNLNLSQGGAAHPTSVARAAFVVSAGQVSAGSVVLRFPVTGSNLFCRLTGVSAAGAPLTLTDTATVAAVGTTGFCQVTITIASLVATNIAFVEVWAA